MSMDQLVVFGVSGSVAVLLTIVILARIVYGDWQVAWAAVISPSRARTAVRRIPALGVGRGRTRRESTVGIAWPTRSGGFRFRIRVPAGVDVAVVHRATGRLSTAVGYPASIVKGRRRTVWLYVTKTDVTRSADASV